MLVALVFYPQDLGAAPKTPGCDVPRGYDCATPGFERPLTLAEAEALSRRETVVYLYGPGLQDARLVAEVMREGENGKPIPAVAVPGNGVPAHAMYVVVRGKVVKHKESGKPVEFYQRFMDRGTIFRLTEKMIEQARTNR